MPPAERRALLLLLTLAVLGHAVRLVLSRPGSAPGELELVQALPGRSPLAHKDSTIALARPLEPGERIDLDRAGTQEVGRLPRVGPGLAKRIVADRQARGPFGSLGGLDRVPGVGPAVLEAVQDHVRFSGVAANAISSSAAVTSADIVSLFRAMAQPPRSPPGLDATLAG